MNKSGYSKYTRKCKRCKEYYETNAQNSHICLNCTKPHRIICSDCKVELAKPIYINRVPVCQQHYNKRYNVDMQLRYKK